MISIHYPGNTLIICFHYIKTFNENKTQIKEIKEKVGQSLKIKINFFRLFSCFQCKNVICINIKVWLKIKKLKNDRNQLV